MSDEVGGNNYSENKESILSLLQSVYTSSASFTGASIKVGVVDSNIEQIVSTFRKMNKKQTNDLGNSISNGSNGSNGLNGIFNILNVFSKNYDKYSKKLADASERQEKFNKTLVGAFKNILTLNFKDGFSGLVSFIAKKFPIWSASGSILYSISKSLIDLQLSNVKLYKELINNGVFFKDGFSDIRKYASQIGTSAENLVKALEQNSTGIAKLYGLTGNGVQSFSKLLESIKISGQAIGMNFATSVKIAGQITEDSSIHMFMMGESMEKLISETEIYQKHLQKLSFATGKSTESILAEAKARDDEAARKLWLSDPKNKMLYTMLKQKGYDDKVIDSFVRGVPTAEFVQAGAFSESVREDLERTWDIYMNKNNVSQEEFSQQLFNTIEQFNDELTKSLLNFYNDNMLFATTIQNIPGGRNALSVMQNTPLLKGKNNEEIFGNILVLDRIEEFNRRIMKIWEKFLYNFSADEDRLNAILDLTERFFDRLTTVIDSILEGHYWEAINRLFNGSEAEDKMNLDRLTQEETRAKSIIESSNASEEDKQKAAEELKIIEQQKEFLKQKIANRQAEEQNAKKEAEYGGTVSKAEGAVYTTEVAAAEGVSKFKNLLSYKEFLKNNKHLMNLTKADRVTAYTNYVKSAYGAAIADTALFAMAMEMSNYERKLREKIDKNPDKSVQETSRDTWYEGRNEHEEALFYRGLNIFDKFFIFTVGTLKDSVDAVQAGVKITGAAIADMKNNTENNGLTEYVLAVRGGANLQISEEQLKVFAKYIQDNNLNNIDKDEALEILSLIAQNTKPQPEFESDKIDKVE